MKAFIPPKSLSSQCFLADERKALGTYVEGFCIRADFLLEVRW